VSQVRLEAKLMNYMKKAMHDYSMVKPGARVLVCLSGGKDSFTMLYLLNKLRIASNSSFEIHSFTLDQQQPGWDDIQLRKWLENAKIPYTILSRDTYSIVKEKIPENKTYCSLCSRLRRGIIYRFARENGYDTVALGHHRDDLIETFLMSVFYNGQIKSMPPKLRTDDGKHLVIRPLALCQESDIIAFAKHMEYPIIPCNLCGTQTGLTRMRVKSLIKHLATENPKVPSNLLRALSNVRPSQLMDKALWDFMSLMPSLNEDAEDLI
jgi:tRNA 2-thiocytidine biosynthesis protein TtcA